MTKTVTHLSKVTEHRGVTHVGTLCRRMSNASDDLNVTTVEAEVTCKFCIKQLSYRRKADRPLTTNQMVAMFAEVLAT